MVRSSALLVLRRIAEAADNDAAQAARIASYRAVDPLFRGLIRKRVARAVARARLSTDHGADEPHVHRLAYLDETGSAASNADDVEAVLHAFRTGLASRPAREPGRWAPTLLAGLLALGTLGAATALWLITRPEPLRGYAEEQRDAFVRGGKPSLGDDAVGELLGSELELIARRLLALPSMEGQQHEQLRTDIATRNTALVARARDVLSPDIASFLQAVLDQAFAMARTPGAPATDSFIRSVDAFNSALAVRGIGYYLDGEVVADRYGGASRVYIASFTIERVRIYHSGDDVVRALLLNRHDRIPFTRGVLGFTRPQVRDALVLLSRVEGWLVSSIAPALIDGKKLELVDLRSRMNAEPWMDEVEAYAAGAVRAECERLTAPLEGYAALSEALARRRKLLSDWGERYASAVTVVDADRYALEPESYDALRSVVPGFEWRELEAVARDLESTEVKRIYRALEDAQVSSIERHEAQHRLDYMHGVLDHMPPELAERVGPLERFGLENVLARRALAELSAYLAELARGPEVVQLNLALFSSHLLNRERWGSPECYAALVVFDGLARSLSIPVDPLVRGRSIARDQVAVIYKQLRSKPSEELSRAAHKLWEELFDRPLPELQLAPRNAP